MKVKDYHGVKANITILATWRVNMMIDVLQWTASSSMCVHHLSSC